MINTQLKKLKFDNKIFYYIVKHHYSDYGENSWTNFFSTNDKIRLVKKYRIFGPLVEVIDNKFLFRLDYSIESCNYTKEKVRKDLTKQVALLGRCDEIKRGQIV